MRGKFGGRFFTIGALFVSLLMVLSACGGGVGGSSSGPSGSSGGTISGVAATGTAIQGVTVELVDSKGHTLTTSKPTGSDGSYSISGTGALTPPFLLKVTSNAGSTKGEVLYSVSAGAGATQTINITPLTDMILRTYYQVQGTNADAAFGGLVNGTTSGKYTPPTPAVVETIAATVKTIVNSVLSSAGISNASNFDPIAGTITAGTGQGYDKVLDDITGYTPTTTSVSVVLNTGGIANTVIVTPSTDDGTVTTTTINSSGTSTTSTLSAANYTASGTYTYDQNTGDFTINTTSSTFPCNGPEAGKTESWTVTYPSSTSMTWTKGSDVMAWTASGTVSGIIGTWTHTDLSTGATYTATINSNGTFSVSGTATSCSGSSSSVQDASGTFTYSNSILSIAVSSSTFVNCTGPGTAGSSSSFTVSNLGATSMKWTDTSDSSNIMNWTRSGSGSGLYGTWTMTDSSTGNSYTATINSNGTWAVVGNIVAEDSCGGSSSSGSSTGEGTYSASGTASYASGTMTITPTSSDYPCNGPEVGQALSFAVSNATPTSMTWTGNGTNDNGYVLNWTITSGTAGSNLAGTWTATDTSGDSYTVTVNPDGTWSMTGTVTACFGSQGDGTYTGLWTDNDGYASASGSFTLTVSNGQLTNDQFTITSGGFGIPDLSGSVDSSTGNFTFTSMSYPSGCPASVGTYTGNIDPTTGVISMTWSRPADTNGGCVAESGSASGTLATSKQYSVPVQITGNTTHGTNIQVCVNYGSNSACGPNGGFAIGSTTGTITVTALSGAGYTVTVPSNQPMASYCTVSPTGSSGTFGNSIQTATVNCQ
ncbi:MAG: hypothetical protein M0Z75_06405 [Nitrospiraceae bacterium]|nr:hypothetical protein [Nitrospiraceae bacterium]